MKLKKHLQDFATWRCDLSKVSGVRVRVQMRVTKARTTDCYLSEREKLCRKVKAHTASSAEEVLPLNRCQLN